MIYELTPTFTDAARTAAIIGNIAFALAYLTKWKLVVTVIDPVGGMSEAALRHIDAPIAALAPTALAAVQPAILILGGAGALSIGAIADPPQLVSALSFLSLVVLPLNLLLAAATTSLFFRGLVSVHAATVAIGIAWPALNFAVGSLLG